MTSVPTGSIAQYVSASVYLPEDDDQKNIRITDLFTEIIIALNVREIGIYSTQETITAESWDDNKTTFRKVYYIPSLTDPGATTIAHELGNISNFTFTNVYGTCRNTAGTIHEKIFARIQFDAANLNVICAAGIYSTYSAVIIAEYIKG